MNKFYKAPLPQKAYCAEIDPCTLKEITSQTDQYLVILSSKTYVFEDKMTKY